MWATRGAILANAWISLVAAQNTTSSAAWPHQTFKSEPTLQPPVFNTTLGTGTPAPGYIIFAPAGVAPQPAPLITTNDNELVWQGPTGEQIFAYHVSTYRGEPVLAYWTGALYPEPDGRGYGTIVIMNTAYEVVANVTLEGHFVTTEGPAYADNVDLHESFITNRDTILITANNATQVDLTSIGGPADGWVVDGQFYEIDIATNRVLFGWSSVDHSDSIPYSIASGVYPLGSEGFDASNKTTAWGYFHINSIAPFGDGYLISSRYTCSAYLIDAHGDVMWRLGGTDGGDFTQGPGTDFCYQHHMRPTYTSPDSYDVPRNFTMHLHDNANNPTDQGKVPSSGLVLNVDLDAMQVDLVQRYLNPDNPLYSLSQGSVQPLAGENGGPGNVFVGRGVIPFIEEYSHDGSIVQTIQFGPGLNDLSYRAFKDAWTGCPKTAPAVFVEGRSCDKAHVDVYVSWNGATDVAAWRVYAIADDGARRVIGEARKSGFETRIRVAKTARMRVEAVLQDGSKCRLGKGGGVSKIINVA